MENSTETRERNQVKGNLLYFHITNLPPHDISSFSEKDLSEERMELCFGIQQLHHSLLFVLNH